MNSSEVSEILVQLRSRGWTLAAIAREMGCPYRTVQQWHLGRRRPSNASSVRRDLERLMERKRIPKGKIYQKPKPGS